jgi:hypothetical protein
LRIRRTSQCASEQGRWNRDPAQLFQTRGASLSRHCHLLKATSKVTILLLIGTSAWAAAMNPPLTDKAFAHALLRR